MKTIEISDEMHEKLIQLATEMTTQDPRSTRMPHIFQIRDWKRVYDWNLNGDFRIYIDNDGDYQTVESADDLIEYLDNRSIKRPSDEDLKLLWENEYVEWEDEDIALEDFISDNTKLEVCSYTEEPVYVNSFLTAKAAQDHLEQNYYHYHVNADVYLNHTWRNPEAELVTEFLCGLIGKKMHT